MVTLVRYIWSMFFAWMPVSLQIVFGAIVAISLIVLIIRVIALLWDAIPFA